MKVLIQTFQWLYALNVITTMWQILGFCVLAYVILFIFAIIIIPRSKRINLGLQFAMIELLQRLMGIVGFVVQWLGYLWVLIILAKAMIFTKAIINTDLFGIILGALLATAGGYFAQLSITRKQRRIEISRYANALYYDIEGIRNSAMAINVFLPDIKSSTITDLKSTFNEIYFDPNWRKCYYKLADVLPSHYLRTLSDLYSQVNSLNVAIGKRDIDSITLLTKKILLDSSNLVSPLLASTTINDILHGLDSLRLCGRFNERTLLKIARELKYACQRIWVIRKVRLCLWDITENNKCNAYNELFMDAKKNTKGLFISKYEKVARKYGKIIDRVIYEETSHFLR